VAELSLMRVRQTISHRVTHAHPGVNGPLGRPHDHQLDITFSVDQPFNAMTGEVTDFSEDVVSVLEQVSDLSKIPGIRPTIPSLAWYLRERLLLRYPSMEIRIDGADDGLVIEVP
jgi:hypothetical protein